MKNVSWYDIGDMPKGMSVDVLYINETFKPASCGILYSAKACEDHGFFTTDEGAMVPAVYCVGWRHAGQPTASLRAGLERVGSAATPGYVIPRAGSLSYAAT